MITTVEYHANQAKTISEDKFQALVIAYAKRQGWIVYHTHDSRRSEPGYPDLHLVHAGRRLSIFRELKTQKGKTTSAQDTWLAALAAAGHDVAVWRPSDWFGSRVIEDQLSVWVTP